MRWVAMAFLITVLLTTSASQAAGDGWGISVGIQGGLSLTGSPFVTGAASSNGEYWEDDDGTDDSARAAFAGGVTVIVTPPGQKVFSIEGGLLYQMKGGVTETKPGLAPSTQTHETAWELNYLTVPLLVRAAGSLGGVRPYLKAGPEFGVLLSAENVSRDGATEDWLSPVDWSILTAAGIETHVGGRGPSSAGEESEAAGVDVYGEISYSYGLTDVLDVPGDADDVELRNRVLGVTVGMRF